jgi:hypothetical protein
MKWFRDNQPKAPENFYMFFGLQGIPPSEPFPEEHWSKRICALMVSHTGPIAEGEKAVNAMRAALPKPIVDWAQPMPYGVIQTLFDPLLPKGLQWYWKGDFVKELPDASIDAYVAHSAKQPTMLCTMHLYPIDGAVHRQAKDSTAWAYRDAGWSMVIAGIDPDRGLAPTVKEWAQAYWKAVHPFNLEGAYPNFMMDDEGEARVKAAFGGNYARLAKTKQKYDPANLFKVNQNIRPAA